MPLARSGEPYPEQSWAGWGDPTQVPALPDPVLALLRDGLGVSASARQAGSIDEVELEPIRLGAGALAELRAVVGSENASSDTGARIRHTRGKSTPDLLRARLREFQSAPDLVLSPGSHDEVLTVLGICSER